jgi:hypothetical protein
MNLDSLSRELENFLAASREAMVIEDGAVIFDLAAARYSISAEHGKCLLHLWSSERNTVRRVLEAELHNDALHLTVLRFGQSRAVKLEVCRSRDRRSVAAKYAARAAYQQLLRRVLERDFPGYRLEGLTSAVDLERSFGPVYARGLLRRGQSATAVLAVNAQETRASVDAALTFGLLWLEQCRQAGGRAHLEGLSLFVPPRTSDVVRARLACLHRELARYTLFELDERAGELQELDCSDRGNIATRLVHCPDRRSAEQRFAGSIGRVLALAPETDIAVLDPGEIAFRLHGLEFARARLASQAGSFRNAEEIVFGLGAAETALTGDTAAQFAELTRRLLLARHPGRGPQEPLWRACPERWLESLVVGDVAALDPRLEPACVYSQVPAFSASDRAMIDVLATTREGRLAVLELKADEDIHLPLQGLDYWARVRWHQQRGEFKRFGYFPGRQIGPEAPLLLLVAPALHVHPATDTLLRYLSPDIDWELLAVDEHWRSGLRVVFRKHPEKKLAADQRR